MPPSNCLRSFSQLSLETTTRTSIASRTLLAPRAATFSTSTARYANPQLKKGRMVAPPKRGTKTLNVKKGRNAAQDKGKRPAPGERKAARKRIVLTNDNALEVSLVDLDKKNALDQSNAGQVMGFPEATVDALRAVEAFKTTQGWGLFRRPASLIRKETSELAKIMAEAEGQKKTVRRILVGDRQSGKSTLVLQGLSMAFLREWVVINLPEAQDITNAHTEYAPLPESEPLQFTQDAYTANLLSQILKANGSIIEKIKVSGKHTLPLQLPANATLKQLLELGIANSEASWPVFSAFWKELTQPGRPPIMLAIDGLGHMMKNSDYLNADVKPIHSFDLTIIRHFIDHLSGAKSLPNGGVVLAATSKSNAPSISALDFAIQVAKARETDPKTIPTWNPYKNVDVRVMEALKDLHSPTKKENGIKSMDYLNVGGLSKDEARTIMEYYAESGMLRAKIDDGFVTEKWSLAGMGNVGELERASVRLRV